MKSAEFLVVGFWFLVVGLWSMVGAIAWGCASGDDDDSTSATASDDDADDDADDDDTDDDTGGGDDDECHVCKASFDCQQDLGDEYECVDLSQDDRPHPEYGETGCCVVSPFTTERCERGMDWYASECGNSYFGIDDEVCLYDACMDGNAGLLCIAYCFDQHAPDCEAAEACWAENQCTEGRSESFECS